MGTVRGDVAALCWTRLGVAGCAVCDRVGCDGAAVSAVLACWFFTEINCGIPGKFQAGIRAVSIGSASTADKANVYSTCRVAADRRFSKYEATRARPRSTAALIAASRMIAVR